MAETAALASKKSGRTPEQQAARDARKAAKAAAAAESSTAGAAKSSDESGKKRKRREEGAEITQEDDGNLLEIDTELPTPLSKAEARKAKRSGKAPAEGEVAEGDPKVDVGKKDKKPKTTAEPKRKNSVWIGNLSFRTNQENLRTFFEQGVKELGGKAEEAASTVTRVNMPTKPGRGSFAENKGFAYVDLATPALQDLALKLSERPLDGRRVLIKRGDDHAPSESTRTPKPLSIVAGTIPKKQPHGESSTLFVGNLPFDATEEELRDLVESSAAATVGKNFTAAQLLKEKKDREEGVTVDDKGEDEDSDDDEDEDEEDEEEDEDEEDSADKEDEEVTTETPKVADNSVQGRRGGEKSGLKKVRLGQFEDTGRCKGFAFLDFQTPQLATFSLANRRNHFMRGRKLVLQYASQEAAKRAGGSGGGASRPEKRQRPSYADKQSREDKPRQAFRPDAPPHAREGADYSRPRDGASEHKPDVRGKRWEAAGRPRPGAALAMAKREKTGIIEGAAPAKKITFD